ncbi:hypothetical protein BGZ83_004008 [Gryganskiella cystojenkinii]|nr:hypothetical protein BGZ83_004008 [Gryganskiella cystojenkinii]
MADHPPSLDPTDAPEQPDASSPTPSSPSSSSSSHSSSYDTADNGATLPHSLSSSSQSIVDLDRALRMTSTEPKTLPTPPPEDQDDDKDSESSKGRQKSFKERFAEDRSGWINGKRPKGYRTPEGIEAAEKCKNYKSGVSVPFLTAKCDTFEGVLKHAVLGAVRSGSVSYGMKAIVNLCLGMIKLMKGRSSFASIFKDAFMGQDAIRMGTFFGLFSFLWKFVNNGLKLYRGTDDRVNGAIAGAIAGLALFVESPERRVTFAQQMFVRSMQGVYNAGKYRGQFSFRHGDAVLFALGSAQVMYAFLMHPDTIPKEFFGFMSKTCRITAEMLAFNRSIVRGFPVDLAAIRTMVDKYQPTARTLEVVATMSEHAHVLPCATVHPGKDSCSMNNLELFVSVIKTIFPVYATLNFVPLMVLRTKRLLKDPVNVASKTSFNTLRSSVFLAVYVTLYQVQICGHRGLLNMGVPIGNSKYLYWLFGLTCAGSAIMIEQEQRRAELAMYVAPKAAESLYKILYRKHWVKGVKHWEVMTFSFAMSLIMSFYQREEQVLSPFVTKIIYHILGKN